MEKQFKYETSTLLWKLFVKTGKINYYLLFNAIEFGKDNTIINENDLGMS